ncbi:MAG: hypothetical protein JAZ19_16325 [Candidatus Thiodiazotropha taylori]|nr:hypothetical protein [Candidatus Thiodiazotropha taylori]
MRDHIVKKLGSNEAITLHNRNQSLKHHFEPSLLADQNRLLPSFPTLHCYTSFSRYLVKRIRRDPRDLRAHVQRTIFFLAKGDAEALYGALIDLFLVLGNLGIEIRRNLLERSESLLTQEQHEFLSAHLEIGLQHNNSSANTAFSSLSKGQSGSSIIVRHKSSVGLSSANNPIVESSEYLQQNDWLTAMMILEDALRYDPGDSAVSRVLISLYRQQGAQEAFFRTYSELIGRRLALPDLWIETEKFFLETTDNQP